jgi:hypothetical protein
MPPYAATQAVRDNPRRAGQNPARSPEEPEHQTSQEGEPLGERASVPGEPEQPRAGSRG